jgi:hypothetical protein
MAEIYGVHFDFYFNVSSDPSHNNFTATIERKTVQKDYGVKS